MHGGTARVKGDVVGVPTLMLKLALIGVLSTDALDTLDTLEPDASLFADVAGVSGGVRGVCGCEGRCCCSLSGVACGCGSALYSEFGFGECCCEGALCWL